MRTISLSSRLQWAFRGTVLPGALATGDVDNDGCKEFVVGSVQGELAIFRGRGGCGTWRYSEDQIEPEFDCWDAVDRGELPVESVAGDTESLTRQSTYTGHVQSASSHRESYSVEDIFHLFGGSDRMPASHANSGDTSEDDGGAGEAKVHRQEAAYTGHIKWEDALEIERDGRKPWVLAQKLGTISSVVVADICNCGHNSVVVVNGEGKCHIFDYPFKRRFHPDLAQRKRQRSHLRKFSQERFFKEGLAVQPYGGQQQQEAHGEQCVDQPSCVLQRLGTVDADGQLAGAEAKTSAAADSQLAPNADAAADANTRAPSTQSNIPPAGSLAAMADHGGDPHHLHGTMSNLEPALSPHQSYTSALPRMAASTAQLTSLASTISIEPTKSLDSETTNPNMMARRSNQNSNVTSIPETIPTSNVSSQLDQPLTILDRRASRGNALHVYTDNSHSIGQGEAPVSPANTRAMHGSGGDQGELSMGEGNVGRADLSEIAIDSLSVAYGDTDADTDLDIDEAASDLGDRAFLSREEVRDIEKIWGANVGKKSGDWFPFVLDRPDMTFSIPTNVEHAMVADIDNNGLNELVLTATDGFVYIFRVMASAKHAVKPTLAPLGMLSNITTTLPSVNMTGNGSPYLYMSAPRSPDASDLELDSSTKGPKAADGVKAVKAREGEDPARTAPPGDSNEGTTEAALEAKSDLNLVNHLLRSIKDASATPVERRPETVDLGGSLVFQEGAVVDTELTAKASSIGPALTDGKSPMSDILLSGTQQAPQPQQAPQLQQAPAQPPAQPPQSLAHFTAAAATTAPVKRRQSTGRRMSLSSRMRENFGGILAGWESARKGVFSYNQTAPPSINHSRVQTAENSGHSTKTHSRMPSVGDDAVDLEQVSAELTSAAVVDDKTRTDSKCTPSHRSATSTADGALQQQRGRRLSHNVTTLDALEEVPERRSNYPESKHTTVSYTVEGSPSAPISRRPSLSSPSQKKTDSGAANSSKALPKPGGNVPQIDQTVTAPSGQQRLAVKNLDSGDIAGFVDPFSSRRQTIGPTSRGHSRSSSIAKPIGSGSRGHSRQGSVSSSIAMLRLTAAAAAAAAHAGESSTGSDLRAGWTGDGSRRDSLGSNVSAREGSIHSNLNAGQAAEPLEVAINARGSFSKPEPSQPPPPKHGAGEDNNSIISQVTEKLTELSLQSGKGLAPKVDSPARMVPSVRARHASSYYDALERDAGLRLPPPRNVIDWSSTNADQVATWFLDNIPGNVSMVNAPSGAFGLPPSQQKRSLYSDSSSECSCSSCDCSLYSSDSEASEASPTGLDQPPAKKPADLPGQPTYVPPTTPAVGAFRDAAAAKLIPLSDTLASHVIAPSNHPGVNLPKPLGLSAIHKERQPADDTGTGEAAGEDSSDSAVQHQRAGAHDRGETRAELQSGEDKQLPGGDSAGQKNEAPASCKTKDQKMQQQHPFLILSKPGGRFVPIDMQKGSLLSTVEPPQVPLAILTGGNTAHMMNIDASESLRGLQLAVAAGLPVPQYSNMDLTTMSGSYLGHSSSWHSGSIPWAQHIPVASFGSAGHINKSPTAVPDAQLAKSQKSQRSFAETPGVSVPHSTEEPDVSQFPVNQPVTYASTETAPRAPNDPGAAFEQVVSRRSQVSAGSQSVFNTGSASGPTSISSTIRSMRGPHKLGSDGARGLPHTSTFGTNVVYRSMTGSGTMTPIGSAFPLGANQYDRRNLGFAGLRGYIGNGTSRQRASGSSTSNMRGEDGGIPHGYYTPLGSGGGAGPASNRGLSIGVGQGIGSGIMPRESLLALPSSTSTNTSAANPADRPGRQRLDGSRQPPRGLRNSPSPLPVASASPQKGQQLSRYSPSMGPWASYKETSVLSTIRDQDDNEARSDVERPRRLSAAGRRLSGDPTMPAMSGREATLSPISDEPAGRAYFMNTEPPSVRSHSSLGTGASAHHLAVEDEKEEEIEEAPQPMELDVATFLVGGVSAGKRRRLILEEPFSNVPPAESAGDEDSEYEMNELVSLVTMDGVISCYDPERKINHFVSLSSKDPVLGIWKAKMHEEVCNPSPLETMRRDGGAGFDLKVGDELLASTPAKRIYRRVGLSRRDLYHAVQYSIYVEDNLYMVDRLETRRRKLSKRMVRNVRSRNQLNYAAAAGSSSRHPIKGEDASPDRSKGTLPLQQLIKSTFSERARGRIAKYNRVGRAVRSIGHHLRDLATGAQTSTTNVSAAVAAPFTPSQPVTDEETSAMVSEYTTPGLSLSPTNRKFAQLQQPSANASSAGRSNDAEEMKRGVANSSHPPYESTASTNEAKPAWMLGARLGAAQVPKAAGNDIAAALTGWYGENKNDYRRSLQVSDHLVVSTWRGTTYFVDVGTLLDIAHYNQLFMHRWNSRAVAAAAEAAAASSSEKDGGSSADTQSLAMCTLYGHLSHFADTNGLISRLRANASVIQFKFQDTVSAFLTDTYAPATGGPNVPCLFYVDYKDRIWVYYHLDEIAEMDDVYGATWLRDELQSLQISDSIPSLDKPFRANCNYDKPFSAVDLAYRRINLDPWMPLPGDGWYKKLISSSEHQYPYSSKTWRKRATACKATASENAPAGSKPRETADARNEPSKGYSFSSRVEDLRTINSSRTPSEASTQGYIPQGNANVTGRFHASFLPGPYMCPIWADINSVDLYDVGSTNLLELATPELLAMKDVFCKELGIDPSSIDEKVNLSTVPGLANWVRSYLYFS
ncbi:hypothetical protein GQ54DRAFT_332773 [Martensiomyces pterosporus]|nr:hypothetical protein GQ54DRAFT_332773 [Martensiomyces pterosporus]